MKREAGVGVGGTMDPAATEKPHTPSASVCTAGGVGQGYLRTDLLREGGSVMRDKGSMSLWTSQPLTSRWA